MTGYGGVSRGLAPAPAGSGGGPGELACSPAGNAKERRCVQRGKAVCCGARTAPPFLCGPTCSPAGITRRSVGAEAGRAQWAAAVSSTCRAKEMTCRESGQGCVNSLSAGEHRRSARAGAGGGDAGDVLPAGRGRAAVQP